MTDQGGSPFDAVEQGPEAPVRDVGVSGADSAGDLVDHPTVTALRGQFDSSIIRHEVQAGDQHVVFVDPARNREILAWLRDDEGQGYDLLVDVTAVDYGGGAPLQVVYQLWSIEHKRALRVKCELPLDALSLDSVVPLWNAANWLEREVFDLFGIGFRDHPDLRRILMPQNYSEGHPLRKDFPLRGRLSRAEQTRLALSQDYLDYYTPEELEVGGAPAGGAPAVGTPAVSGPGVEPRPTHDSTDQVEAD